MRAGKDKTDPPASKRRHPPLRKGGEKREKRDRMENGPYKRIHNKQLVPLAKTLRKGMTREEKHLWYDFLRSYPLNFIRQKIIGVYIADFYCPKARLVVELDGSQHYTEEGRRNDANRDLFIEGYGITVLHISNYDIHTNYDGVCMEINRQVGKKVRYDPLKRQQTPSEGQ